MVDLFFQREHRQISNAIKHVKIEGPPFFNKKRFFNVGGRSWTSINRNVWSKLRLLLKIEPCHVMCHIPWLLVLCYLKSSLGVSIFLRQPGLNASLIFAAWVTNSFLAILRRKSHLFISICTWEMISSHAPWPCRWAEKTSSCLSAMWAPCKFGSSCPDLKEVD